MYSSVAAVGSLGRDEVRSVLHSATKGSPDNGDWSVQCAGPGFEIRYTGPGERPIFDDDRELLVRCGRILLDLRVAIRACGVHPTVQLMPDDEEPELVAVVLPQGRSVPTPDDLALFEAIDRVGEDGQRPAVNGVPPDVMSRLRQAAKIEQSWIATLSAQQVEGLRSGSDSSAPREVSTRPPAAFCSETHYGGPVTAVIGSLRDLPAARLQAGQALERVRLTAVCADVPATLLPGVVAAVESRKRVRDLIGGGLWPHGVLRLGGVAPPNDVR